MDTFGGPPTKGESRFFVFFCAVILVGLGFVGGLIFCAS
jgi:hypothetical protein